MDGPRVGSALFMSASGGARAPDARGLGTASAAVTKRTAIALDWLCRPGVRWFLTGCCGLSRRLVRAVGGDAGRKDGQGSRARAA